MKTRATVRVRMPPGQIGSQPVRMKLAADVLKQSGFKVLRIGRVGVSVEADAQVFRRELGVEVPIASGTIATNPHRSDLSDLVDLVEIAGKPLHF